MKSAIFSILLAIIGTSAQSAGIDECAQAGQSQEANGFNCAVPFDAHGPALYHSERVLGRVIWASSMQNPHGLYEFIASYAYFQLRGYSRLKPVVGESVEVVIRAALYAGRFTQRDK